MSPKKFVPIVPEDRNPVDESAEEIVGLTWEDEGVDPNDNPSFLHTLLGVSTTVLTQSIASFDAGTHQRLAAPILAPIQLVLPTVVEHTPINPNLRDNSWVDYGSTTEDSSPSPIGIPSDPSSEISEGWSPLGFISQSQEASSYSYDETDKEVVAGMLSERKALEVVVQYKAYFEKQVGRAFSTNREVTYASLVTDFIQLNRDFLPYKELTVESLAEQLGIDKSKHHEVYFSKCAMLDILIKNWNFLKPTVTLSTMKQWAQTGQLKPSQKGVQIPTPITNHLRFINHTCPTTRDRLEVPPKYSLDLKSTINALKKELASRKIDYIVASTKGGDGQVTWGCDPFVIAYDMYLDYLICILSKCRFLTARGADLFKAHGIRPEFPLRLRESNERRVREDNALKEREAHQELATALEFLPDVPKSPQLSPISLRKRSLPSQVALLKHATKRRNTTMRYSDVEEIIRGDPPLPMSNNSSRRSLKTTGKRVKRGGKRGKKGKGKGYRSGLRLGWDD